MPAPSSSRPPRAGCPAFAVGSPRSRLSLITYLCLGRDAAVAGIDATDYQLSVTARSFVPFYAQRISHNIVMHGAQGILDGISRARNKQLRAATGAA